MGYKGTDLAGSGATGSLFTSSPSGLECSASAAPVPPYQVLNIRYDLTSMRNVSAVITEVGLIPPTSIPVLIRELRLDQR
jgi:translation initiation factor eIF-2B subunit delta